MRDTSKCYYKTPCGVCLSDGNKCDDIEKIESVENECEYKIGCGYCSKEINFCKEVKECSERNS